MDHGSDFHFLGEARDPVAAQVLELGPVEQAALRQHLFRRRANRQQPPALADAG